MKIKSNQNHSQKRRLKENLPSKVCLWELLAESGDSRLDLTINESNPFLSLFFLFG